MEFQISLLYWRVVKVTFQCGNIDFVWGTHCVSLKSSFRCTSPILPGIGENGGSLAITETAGINSKLSFSVLTPAPEIGLP
jgi:hypothetical protein